ncbi:MAG: hypothetical protein ACO3F3_18595, partial [Gemmataceae bacterium]
ELQAKNKGGIGIGNGNGTTDSKPDIQKSKEDNLIKAREEAELLKKNKYHASQTSLPGNDRNFPAHGNEGCLLVGF